MSEGALGGRIAGWLLAAIGLYSLAFIGLLNLVALPSGDANARAIVLMADGLIGFWIIGGGALTPWLRAHLVPRLVTLPIRWPTRFALLCLAMALIEEAIATGMTNLAPILGVSPAEAHITASTNYFKVVLFHSAVVFAPMFVAWAWLLSRWDFAPREVMLLFGITGSLAEGLFNPANAIGGFWVFVYGLMVYLPACTIPRPRAAHAGGITRSRYSCRCSPRSRQSRL